MYNTENRGDQPSRPDRKLSANWTFPSLRDSISDHAPGCGYGCLYCNQAGMDVGKNGEDTSPYITTTVDSGISLNTSVMKGNIVIKSIEPSLLVEELASFPFYNSETPLLLQNFTDPSLDWRSTFDLISLLRERLRHSGPIILITKGCIPEKYVAMAKEFILGGAELYFIVTYSGLPDVIEPVSSRGRESAIKRLSQSGIPVIMSMRPLIEGINTSREHIQKMLGEIGCHASAVTFGGLYAFEFSRDAFARAGHPLPAEYDKATGAEFKLLSEGTKETILDVASEFEGLHIYRHTTCAIAFLRQKFYGKTQPDRLAHWALTDPQFADCSGCNLEQMKECQQQLVDDPEEKVVLAETRAREIGFEVKIIPSVKPGVLLIVDGDLHLSELFFLTEACGWNVENLPSDLRLMSTIKNFFRDRGIEISEDNITVSYEPSTTLKTVTISGFQSASPEFHSDLQEFIWRKTRSHFFSIIM